MRYFLDTTFLIDYMRGNPAALGRFRTFFEQGDQLLINEVVVCELATGITSPQRPAMTALLRPLEFVQPGPDTALRAGDWRQAARQVGFALSLTDALIAATAHELDAHVVTRNLRDFANTPVAIETY